MEGPKVRKRALLRVLLAGLSVFAMASTVGAVPVVTDCPGGSCDLQELLDGSSITIGDKQFHNFRNFSSTAGGGALQPGLPLSAGSIPVTSQEDLGAFGVDGEIGLLFKFANAVVLSGQNTLTIGWEYDVTVVGGNNAIVDNTLMFPGGGIFQGEMLQSTADTALGASLQVLEVVSTPPTSSSFERSSLRMSLARPRRSLTVTSPPFLRFTSAPPSPRMVDPKTWGPRCNSITS